MGDAAERAENDDKNDYYLPYECPTCQGTGWTPKQYIGHEGRAASFPCNHTMK